MAGMLDRLPGRQFEQVLRQASNNVLEEKARQRTSGASGQLGYEIADRDGFLFSFSPPPVGSGAISTGSFHIDLEAEEDWPEAVIILELYVNGVDVAHKAVPDGQTPLYWSDGTNFLRVGALELNRPDQGLYGDPRKMKWTTLFSYSGTIDVHVRPFIRATAPAALTGGVN